MKKEVFGKETVKNAALTALWMLALSAVFCALAAALVIGGAISQQSIRTAAAVCAALGVFTAQAVRGKSVREGKLLWGLLGCGWYLAVLLLGNLLFLPQPPGGIAVMALCSVGASLAAVLLPAGKGANRRKIRK